MSDRDKNSPLPSAAQEFIEQLVKHIRYKKKVRRDVRDELVAHFEDALGDCPDEQSREEVAKAVIGNFGDPKLVAKLIRRGKKRCWPLWVKVLLRALATLGVILGFVIFRVLTLIIGSPGELVDYSQVLSEKVRQGRDESVNAWHDYKAAAESLDEDFYKKLPEAVSDSHPHLPENITPEMIEQVGRALQDSGRSFALLEAGAAKPFYWNNYEFWLTYDEQVEPPQIATNEAFMKLLGKYKRLTQRYALKINYDVYLKKYDRAVDELLVLNKFGDHQTGKGLLIEQLVGVAIKAMAVGEIYNLLDETQLNEEQLQKLFKGLAADGSRKETVVDVELEKYFFYDKLQRCFTKDGRMLLKGIGFGFSDWGELAENFILFDFPREREVLEQVDRSYEEVARYFGKTPYELHEIGWEDNDWEKLAPDLLMMQILAPAFGRVQQLNWRLRADESALGAVIALKLYRARHGRYPEQLVDLVCDKIIEEVPNDPFGEGAFIYRKAGDDFILYSAGYNFVDDGGSMENYKWKEKNLDIVFWPVFEKHKK